MFEQVKQEIDDKIKTNGNNEITANRLNGVLQDMMDASAEVIGEVQQSIGDQVEANPTGEPTESLEKIKIGEEIYEIPQGVPSDMSFDKKLQTQANINNQESSEAGRLGYVVLQPEKQGVATTTFAAQIANKPNTIFEIREVFDLNNGSVTIPSGCTLKFNGGRIINGTIIGDYTQIGASYQDAIFSTTTILQGTWKNIRSSVVWYGAKQGGDPTLAIQHCFDDIFHENYIPNGNWVISDTLLISKTLSKSIIMDGDVTRNSSPRTESKEETVLKVVTDITAIKVEYGNTYSENESDDTAKTFEIHGGLIQQDCEHYSNALVVVSADNGSKIWGCNIETTLMGKYDDYSNNPIGLSFVASDNNGGHLSYIKNNSQIINFGIGTKVNSSAVGTDRAWITSYDDNADYCYCKTAVSLHNITGGSILGVIQSAPILTGLDLTPVIYIDGKNINVGAMIWDLTAKSNVNDQVTRHTNIIGIEFSEASKGCRISGNSFSCFPYNCISNQYNFVLDTNIYPIIQMQTRAKGFNPLFENAIKKDTIDTLTYTAVDCTYTLGNDRLFRLFNPYSKEGNIPITPSSKNAEFWVELTLAEKVAVLNICVEYYNIHTFDNIVIELYADQNDVTPSETFTKDFYTAINDGVYCRLYFPEMEEKFESGVNIKRGKIIFKFSGASRVDNGDTSPAVISGIYVKSVAQKLNGQMDYYEPNELGFATTTQMDSANANIDFLMEETNSILNVVSEIIEDNDYLMFIDENGALTKVPSYVANPTNGAAFSQSYPNAKIVFNIGEFVNGTNTASYFGDYTNGNNSIETVIVNIPDKQSNNTALTSLNGVFKYLNNAKSLYIKGCKNIIELYSTFSNNAKLEIIDLSEADLSKVSKTDFLFSQTPNLITLKTMPNTMKQSIDVSGKLKFSVESVQNVIDWLYDFTGTQNYDDTVNTYDVGDVVIYNSETYICKQAVELNEGWTSSKWVKTTKEVKIGNSVMNAYNVGKTMGVNDFITLVSAKGWTKI